MERPPPLTQPRRDGDPLGALASSDHDSDREDPAAESGTGGLIVPPKQMSSALGSLIANYGSMTESESDEEPEATPILRGKDLVKENQALLNAIPSKSQERGPPRGWGDSPQGAEDHKVSQPNCAPHTPHGRRGRGGRGGRRGHQDTPQTRRPTLLEMLLAPDVRHERNVLLQCVRYVVRNNFFGLERRPENKEATKGKVTPAIPAGEHEGRQEEPSEARDELRAASGVGGKKSSAEVELETNKADVVDQFLAKNGQDQVLQSGRVCSEPSGDVDSSAGQVAENFIQNPEETTATDNITSTSNIYDDEIWESPGIVL